MMALMMSVAAAACGGGGDDGACPADEPATCPTTAVPSYATQIAPLIATYCATAECHSAMGSASDQPLSTYADLKHRLGEAHSQIYQCRMPLEPPDPTLDERVTLLTWFVCGGPNN